MFHKGLKKQEAWIENIRAIQDERGASLDLDVRKLLDTIIGFDNIPRKRNKFVNFVQVHIFINFKYNFSLKETIEMESCLFSIYNSLVTTDNSCVFM